MHTCVPANALHQCSWQLTPAALVLSLTNRKGNHRNGSIETFTVIVPKVEAALALKKMQDFILFINGEYE